MININQPRKLDSAGRISIPKGTRDKFCWNEGMEFTLFESEAYETDCLMIVPTQALDARPVEDRVKEVLAAYDINDEMMVRDICEALVEG